MVEERGFWVWKVGGSGLKMVEGGGYRVQR
jgi:hypothetical protein